MTSGAGRRGILVFAAGLCILFKAWAVVIAPPIISKSFGAPSTVVGGTELLSFSISNPNASALTGVGFTDVLPAGLVVATPNGLIGSCGGGTITATAGSGSISLSGATLPAGPPCSFFVTVKATTFGPKFNTTGPVTSTEAGNGNTASASLTVLPAEPPELTKTFGGFGPPVTHFPLGGSIPQAS